MAAYALSAATGTEIGGGKSSAAGGKGIGSEDFSANEAACRVWSNTDSSAYVYKCSAKGYEGVNKATVTVNKDAGTVTSITVDEFKDTSGVGDKATADAELARYAGASLDSAIDATAGATFTSSSLRAMAAAALNMAAGN
jgi:Na+-translocating ferredoxin:NAD+ oxidoreductase RnfG subunit